MNEQGQRVPAELAEELLIDAEVDDPGRPRPKLVDHPVLVAVAMVLLAANLRPALSSLAPLLPELRLDTGISATMASVLTTVPVTCLGLAGPLAPFLARRFGTERVIFVVMLLLAGGLALRGLPGMVELMGGSILAGIAIGIVGVLLPGLIKRDFAGHTALMMGVYTMALCFGAASAAGLTVPVQRIIGQGWRPALAFWALPAVLAAVVWLPQVSTRRGHRAAGRVSSARRLWRDRLAWQVTLFMGLQSSLAYCVFGWLAPILRDRGADALTAGLMVSWSIILQLVTALTAPMLATRGKDQSLSTLICLVTIVAGLLGCFYAPMSSMWFWTALLGLGQGAIFAIALTIIVLRSPDAHVAAHLSGMAQSVGYVLASCGPLAMGLLHDLTGGWDAGAMVCMVLAAGAAVTGWQAGRALHVQA